MRSVWCTLVAVCLLAGGTGVRDEVRARATSSSIHAVHAPALSVARRVPQRSSKLGPFALPAAVGAPAVRRVAIADTRACAPSTPEQRLAFLHPARGPPRA